MKIKDIIDNYKDKLSDYTDEELYEFLDKNQITEHRVLACICSEILRRMVRNED